MPGFFSSPRPIGQNSFEHEDQGRNSIFLLSRCIDSLCRITVKISLF